MQRIVYAGGKGKSRGQACYKRKKDPGGKGRQRRKGDLPIYKEQRRDRGLAQKRANVDKIGGGSLQLLAGMSGNAWDSILKARPRQSPPSLLPPPASYPSASLLSRLSSTAIPWGPYLVQGDPGNTSRLPDRVARSPWSHRVLNPRTTLTWDARCTLVLTTLCELNSGAGEVTGRDNWEKRRKFINIFFRKEKGYIFD